MTMTPTEHANHGYTITEFAVVGGGKNYGLVWLDTGEHTCGYSTADAAEAFAESYLQRRQK